MSTLDKFNDDFNKLDSLRNNMENLLKERESSVKQGLPVGKVYLFPYIVHRD